MLVASTLPLLAILKSASSVEIIQPVNTTCTIRENCKFKKTLQSSPMLGKAKRKKNDKEYIYMFFT